MIYEPDSSVTDLAFLEFLEQTFQDGLFKVSYYPQIYITSHKFGHTTHSLLRRFSTFMEKSEITY